MNKMNAPLAAGPIDTAGGTPDPIVVIIGGFGMTDRHLRYHERLYKSFGLTTIVRLTYPVLTLTRPKALRREATKLERMLLEEHSGAPVVFHLFSGAIFLYHYLIGAMQSQLRARMRAVVFESTPLDLKSEQFGRFLAWRLGVRYRPIMNLPFIPYRRIVRIAGSGEIANERQIDATPTDLEALIISADNDPILSQEYITSYSARIAALGANVSRLRLSSARHCRAIIEDPGTYRESINCLLERACIAESKGLD